MKTLIAIDNRLIEITQEVYLWLWDRTGVYVATLMFAAYVGDHVCWGPLHVGNFIFLALAGAWASRVYFVQSKDLRRLNDLQRGWRDFVMRPYLTMFGFAMIVEQVLYLDVWRFASNVLMMVWTYLNCVQVREREPKDFFAIRKPVGAGA